MRKLLRNKLLAFLLAFTVFFVVAIFASGCFIYYQHKISASSKYESFVAETTQDCRAISDNAERTYCYEKILNVTLTSKGIDAAFDLVSDFYASEPNFAQTCHSLTHIIGQKAYRLFEEGKDFELSPKTAYCSYGFYHGFMETLLINTKDISQAGKFCDYVNDKLKNQTSDAKLSCYHGIGHGTVGVHDPRIRGDAQKMIDPALNLCEEVSTDDTQLFRCASGIFNAIAIFYRTGEYGLPLDKTDPLKICLSQKDKYKESCYGNMNTLLDWLTRSDFKTASSFAEKVKTDADAITTIEYLSALEALQTNTDQLVTGCRSLQDRLHLPCIKGVAHGFMEKGKPGEEYIRTIEFCKRQDLDSKEKEVCFAEAINYANRIYPRDKANQICRSLDSDYQKFCRP